MSESGSRPNAAASAWSLDPTVTFLNHGSFGACPTAVLDAQQRWRARMEAEPVRFFVRELEDALDSARLRLAQFVGADPDNLAFVHNATAAVNTVVRSLTFEPGDELLTTNQSYAACVNALQYVAGRAGARVLVVPIPFPLRSSDEVADAILGAVTPRTRFALIDHITSPTGVLFPVERLVAELSSRGVEVMVDGAHAPGMVPLDLEQLGATWYAANLHKWTCAPKGAAFLWCRRDHRDALRPLVISHGATSRPSGTTRFRAEFDWQGTIDPTAWLSVPDAIDTVGALEPGGWPAVMHANRSGCLAARAVLCSRLGIDSPAPDDMIGSIAAVPLPPAPRTDAAALPGSGVLDPVQDGLWFDHQIDVPVVAWPAPPERLIRISYQRYNQPSDYVRLANALATVLGPPPS